MHVSHEEDFENCSRIHSTNMQSKAEQRRSNKPIMEKKRRARINHCLNELKSLILDAMKKDPARHSKLEKADILEMTVKHLQTVQRQQLAIAVATDPAVLRKFKNGFSECAEEVTRYIGNLPGVETGVQHRLSNHLTKCVMGLDQIGPVNYPIPAITINTASLGAGEGSGVGSGSLLEDINNNGARSRSLQLSRLPSGEFALLVPGSAQIPFLPSVSGLFSTQASTTVHEIRPSGHPGSAFVSVNPQKSPASRPYTVSSPPASPASSTTSSLAEELRLPSPRPMPSLMPSSTSKRTYASAFRPTKPLSDLPETIVKPSFTSKSFCDTTTHTETSSHHQDKPLSVITNQSERYKMAQHAPDSQFCEENAPQGHILARKRLYPTEYFHQEHGFRAKIPKTESEWGGVEVKTEKAEPRPYVPQPSSSVVSVAAASSTSGTTSGQPEEAAGSSASGDMWRPW